MADNAAAQLIIDGINKEIEDFISSDCQKTVGTMIASFMRKKKAFESINTSQIKSGSIDFTRLAHYKTSEDIFRRKQLQPKGKNHGIFFLIDWSSSMSDVRSAVIKQTVINAVFCKRAGIPFVAAYFTNGSRRYGNNTVKNKEYEVNNEGLMLNILFDSNDKIEDIKQTMQNINLVFSGPYRNAINGDYTTEFKVRDLIFQYEMNGTPLSIALSQVFPYVVNWKRASSIDSVSLYCITDGADTDGLHNHRRDSVTRIVNPFTNKSYDIPESSRWGDNEDRLKILQAVLSMYREMGINTYNFFLINKGDNNTLRNALMRQNYTTESSKIWESMRKNSGYCEMSNIMGFDHVIFTDPKIFSTTEEDAEFDSTSIKKLTKALEKNLNRNKILNTIGNKVVDCVTQQYKITTR